ncbi:2Fe-2S iron-sulfur cluster-binding protein [Burkholderia gladioli]|uniref:2Fe-2S iron-sulfur cluster-binding protein n=1 Tax=Burkholderia gladioli TaxID=28095 RepID=UPI001FC8A022|nr:2Fe-2S iron-sulfur cluster-binding protein [Burkholderia gladioli]MDD1785090.1 (2Fe-2S)-binding protein [Burkholderia gladioli]MDN7722019.1 2Fe-2S iron-sulfur cluster-binding protein [Burkholderia gladioli]MDN7812462.1 2Fe-2S iron-sulfur cluster-binding protein [Burkholderia gladioli]
MILPQNVEATLPAGCSLTDLEFELYGQDSINFGCKAGACGTCAIQVLEGLAHLGVKGDEETAFLDQLGFPGNEFRLACQCRLNGEVRIRAASFAHEDASL